MWYPHPQLRYTWDMEIIEGRCTVFVVHNMFRFHWTEVIHFGPIQPLYSHQFPIYSLNWICNEVWNMLWITRIELHSLNWNAFSFESDLILNSGCFELLVLSQKFQYDLRQIINFNNSLIYTIHSSIKMNLFWSKQHKKDLVFS